MSKLAVVTGAGQGIGKGIAKRLARAGYAIAVVDINPKTAPVVAANLRKQGYSAKAYILDIANRKSVFDLVQKVVHDLGELKVWVNNAGVAFIQTLVKTDPKRFNRLIDVNLKGTYWGIQAAAQQFIKQGHGGRIVNAASLAGEEASALQSAYSVSKFAIRGMTQSAAKELAKYHITVNAYNPGVVRTQLRDHIDRVTAKIKHITIPQQQASVLNEIDLHREATPADVANLVAWLVAPATNYITGQSIMVDGGMHYL